MKIINKYEFILFIQYLYDIYLYNILFMRISLNIRNIYF